MTGKLQQYPSPSLMVFTGATLLAGLWREPRLFIHAYVSCDDVVGDISRSCLHGRGPHTIKVVILKVDNDRQIMSMVHDLAGPDLSKKKGRGRNGAGGAEAPALERSPAKKAT